MKDEEMAEKYIEKNCKIWEEGELTVDEIVRLAFLAGLKAGRPQWHDLEKDPNDLPSDRHGHVVMNQDWDKVVIRNGRFEHLDGYKADVIKWCEIPTFDKE